MYSNYLLSKFKELFDEDTLKGLENPPPISIRVNTIRIGEKALIERLAKKGVRLRKIPWVKYGYYVDSSPFSMGATTEYLMGYYFLQDPASMYCCEVLEPVKGDVVLDMAAAPGGKTTYLAQLMENRGTIISIELNRERMRSLRSNITRMGVENVIAVRMNALESKELGIEFDKVLLDAPCTGTGTIFKNPDAGNKDAGDVERCTSLQRELVDVAYDVLKKRGILVYSTCSILPEEDEFIVRYAVEKGFKLLPVAEGTPAFTEAYGVRLGGKMRFAKRFYPHLHGSQGFFIAKLQKKPQR